MNFSNYKNGDNLAFLRIFPFLSNFYFIIKSEPGQMSKMPIVKV